MKTEQFKAHEKELCDIQQALIQIHLSECKVCKASFDSWMKPIKAPGNKTPSRIPDTPPCKIFLQGLQEHMDSCNACKTVNIKWNADAIPISEQMRSITSKMKQGTATKEEMEILKKELQDKLGVKPFGHN